MCLVANKATHKTEACSLSGSSGDADIKSKFGDTAGEGVSGKNREWHGNICITLCKTDGWC